MQALSPAWIAPLANGAALLLALGFRRNRAVLILLVLLLSASAWAGYPASGRGHEDAVLMFAPWLLLAVAAMPERSLLARRNLLLLVFIAIVVWLSIDAPAHVWSALRAALPFGALPWAAGTVAAALILLAAGLCLLRWMLGGGPMEAGLSVVLLCSAVAALPITHAEYGTAALALAGVCALLAVLYASYRMAFVDALSGLPNRRALDEALARLSGNFAVAMIDIDHFKRFNDTHGHAAGDLVLKAIGPQLRAIRGGSAYRYGGEEFCVLFSGAHSRGAAAALEAARERVEQSRVRIRSAPPPRRRTQAVKRSEASDVRVTISAGLAGRDAAARTPGEVLKAADQALYRAKAKGRNCVVVD
ncbi:MAG TPA: GGDEF domain-containing protein [Rudaea sp.]|nr:GGDEF domain-containing protein [Rudaea sp.]